MENEWISACKILQVDPQSSLDEIKKAHRALAKKFHPDKNPGNKQAEKKFLQLQNAFDFLCENHELMQNFFEQDTQETEVPQTFQQSAYAPGPKSAKPPNTFSPSNSDVRKIQNQLLLRVSIPAFFIFFLVVASEFYIDRKPSVNPTAPILKSERNETPGPRTPALASTSNPENPAVDRYWEERLTNQQSLGVELKSPWNEFGLINRQYFITDNIFNPERIKNYDILFKNLKRIPIIVYPNWKFLRKIVADSSPEQMSSEIATHFSKNVFQGKNMQFDAGKFIQFSLTIELEQNEFLDLFSTFDSGTSNGAQDSLVFAAKPDQKIFENKIFECNCFCEIDLISKDSLDPKRGPIAAVHANLFLKKNVTPQLNFTDLSDKSYVNACVARAKPACEEIAAPKTSTGLYESKIKTYCFP